MEKIEPLGDRVLVKPDPPKSKTEGKLIIPKTAQEPPQRGTVKAVGNSPNITLKEGDSVFYAKNSGTKFEGDLLMFNEPSILAVIRK